MTYANRWKCFLILCCVLWVVSGEAMAENVCSNRVSLAALPEPLKIGDLKKKCGDIFLQGHGLYIWTKAYDAVGKDYWFLFKPPEWMKNKEDPRWQHDLVEEEIEIGAIVLVDNHNSNDGVTIWPNPMLGAPILEVMMKLWKDIVSDDDKRKLDRNVKNK